MVGSVRRLCELPLVFKEMAFVFVREGNKRNLCSDSVAWNSCREVIDYNWMTFHIRSPRKFGLFSS